MEKKEKAPKEQDDSDDSIDWGSSDESESDSSEDDNQYVNIRERFLKRPDKEDKDDDVERRKKKAVEKIKARKRREEDDEEGEWTPVTKGSATSAEKPKMFEKDAEIDIRLVLNKLNEVSNDYHY